MAGKVGHPSKWEDWKDRLVVLQGMARDGATDEDLAARCGINIRTWYEWKARYPQLAQAVKDSKDDVDRAVENALLKRALGAEYTDTKITATKDGKVLKVEKTTRTLAPSEVAAFFWLKNRNPERYRDRREFMDDKGDQLAAVIAAIKENVNSDETGKSLDQQAAELIERAAAGAAEAAKIEEGLLDKINDAEAQDGKK